jgi:HD-like signal output (HDOD) protein
MQLLQSNRRTSNEQPEGADGVKVLSKKMISFRTHSKSQEKNSKIYAENSERMAEFRSQQPTVKSAENTKLNQT